MVGLDDYRSQPASMLFGTPFDACSEREIDLRQCKAQMAVWRQVDEIHELSTPQVSVRVLICGRTEQRARIPIVRQERTAIPIPGFIVRAAQLSPRRPITVEGAESSGAVLLHIPVGVLEVVE